MTVASIDIGTNTILLLIAETDQKTKKIKAILNEQRIPRIGKGLTAGKSISPERSELLFNILNDYKEIILKYNCDKIILTATNAFRIASNSSILVDAIKRKFNFDVEIISGDEEARFAFLGAASGYSFEKILVIDIGGGSTELTLGIGEDIFYNKSFPIGVIIGTEKYLLNDPPSVKQIENFSKYLTGIFGDAAISAAADFAPQKSIAIAGTPTTLACIKQNLDNYEEDKIEGSILTVKDLEKLSKILADYSSFEIADKYGLVVKGREDILLAGTIILSKLMGLLKIDEVIVSTKGIRYGAIINYLMKIKD